MKNPKFDNASSWMRIIILLSAVLFASALPCVAQDWVKTHLGKMYNKTYDLTIADGDNDGKLEVYAASGWRLYRFQYSQAESKWIWVDEDSVFFYWVNYINAFAFADLDDDSYNELYVAGDDGKVNRFLWEVSKGAYRGWADAVATPGKPIKNFALGDVDNDGKVECCYLYYKGQIGSGSRNDSWNLQLCLNANDPWVESLHFFTDYAMVSDFLIDDLDNNGTNELYIGFWGDSLYQCMPDYAQQKWQTRTFPDIPFVRGQVGVGDVNRDGKKELYYADWETTDYPIVQVTWNETKQTFEVTDNLGSRTGWPGFQFVTVGDADNDGSPEVYGGHGDEHIYQYRYKVQPGITWTWTDLGFAETSLQWGGKMVVGDGDGIGLNELYLGTISNSYTGPIRGQVYQFTAPRVNHPPNILVTAPNGGENWQIGKTYDITWQAADPDGDPLTIDIDYSVNGGSNWTAVASGENNDGNYAWTIPNTPSTTCRVRIKAADHSLVAEDISDTNFAIVEQALEPPSVAILAPQALEELPAQQSYTIKWTATYGKELKITIDYSIDFGVRWTNIVTNTANDGEYDWLVPDEPSTLCVIKVTATCAQDGATASKTTGNFTILGLPSTVAMNKLLYLLNSHFVYYDGMKDWDDDTAAAPNKNFPKGWQEVKSNDIWMLLHPLWTGIQPDKLGFDVNVWYEGTGNIVFTGQDGVERKIQYSEMELEFAKLSEQLTKLVPFFSKEIEEGINSFVEDFGDLLGLSIEAKKWVFTPIKYKNNRAQMNIRIRAQCEAKLAAEASIPLAVDSYVYYDAQNDELAQGEVTQANLGMNAIPLKEIEKEFAKELKVKIGENTYEIGTINANVSFNAEAAPKIGLHFGGGNFVNGVMLGALVNITPNIQGDLTLSEDISTYFEEIGATITGQPKDDLYILLELVAPFEDNLSMNTMFWDQGNVRYNPTVAYRPTIRLKIPELSLIFNSKLTAQPRAFLSP